MLARSPDNSEATTTTVVMPITIPITVSMERKRCAQTASIAMAMFSLGDTFISLLRPQSHYRIQFGSLQRGIPAADNANRGRNHHRQKHIKRRYPQRDAERLRQGESGQRSDPDANAASRERHNDGLDQNLQHDIE